MNTLNLRVPASLLLSCGLAFGAAAQAPVQQELAAGSQERSGAPAASAEDAGTLEPDEKAARQREEGSASDRHCLRETGSRLVRADRTGRKCANASGRSYSREDLEQTGHTGDLGAALRALDSSIN